MYTLTLRQAHYADGLKREAVENQRPFTDLRAIQVSVPNCFLEVYPELGGRTRDGLNTKTVERKYAYYTVTMKVREVGAIGIFWDCTDHVPGDNEDDAVEAFRFRHRHKYETSHRVSVVLHHINVSNALTIKV